MAVSGNNDNMPDWSLCVGFFFVLILTITTIDTIVGWVMSLKVSRLMKIFLNIVGILLWLCGLAFLYHAERQLFSKRK